MDITSITTCRACDSMRLRSLFSLGDQHLTGVFPAINQKHPPKAPLELVLCENCSLVQLLDSCEPNFLYGPSYGYRSGLNKSMREHLSQTARSCRILIGNLNSFICFPIQGPVSPPQVIRTGPQCHPMIRPLWQWRLIPKNLENTA